MTRGDFYCPWCFGDGRGDHANDCAKRAIHELDPRVTPDEAAAMRSAGIPVTRGEVSRGEVSRFAPRLLKDQTFADMRRHHQPAMYYGRGPRTLLCRYDRQSWPCDVDRLLKDRALRTEQALLAALNR